MRLAILFIFSLSITSVVYSHEHSQKIEQRIGLKTQAVIKNEMRLLGIDISQITMHGAKAEISTEIQGQPVRIRVDRITGAMQQVGGRVQLDPALLNNGVIQLDR